MILRTIFIAIALLSLPAVAHAEEERRTVGPFTAVVFKGTGMIDIAVGKEQSLTLDADKDLLGNIITEVKGNTLEIGLREHHSNWSFWGFLQWLGSPSHDGGNDKLHVTIAVPRLGALSIAGAAKVNVDGFEGGDTSVTISGASDIRASGRLDHLALRISGAGDAKLGDLVTTGADVSLTGAGNVLVQPTQSLHAEISGIGHVRYIGDPPHVTKNVSGMGKVERQ
jgi:hypothetical protein